MSVCMSVCMYVFPVFFSLSKRPSSFCLIHFGGSSGAEDDYGGEWGFLCWGVGQGVVEVVGGLVRGLFSVALS